MARQAAARKTQDVEVLPAVNQDVQLVEGDSSIIKAFFGNLAAFFSRASDLEQSAKQLLVDARKLQPPTNGDEDLRIQQVIKTAHAAQKTVEEHWGICQAVSRLHRKLTAKRALAVQSLEDAAAFAQRLHNRYVDDERARVAREAEAERRRQEDLARQEQERQAAALEEQALKAEAASPDLSEREQLFVDSVFIGNSAIIAAKSAGYKDPVRQGPRLLNTPKIHAAITAKQDAAVARAQAEAIRQQPVEVEVERPAMDVVRTGVDRTTWSGEIVDEVAFIHAAMAGKHGIPLDVLQINPVKLNEYARSLHERLDLWPGVRAKKTTRTV